MCRMNGFIPRTSRLWSALELESDEIQEAESFTSRDEIISRMRDCLLAKELTAGDKVLFVATEPYGGPGDFDLRGGVIRERG